MLVDDGKELLRDVTLKVTYSEKPGMVAAYLYD